MRYVLAYIIYLLAFTVFVWAIEAVFILFAVIFRNRSFINFISGATLIISYIYQFVLTIGAFFWLWSAVGLLFAIIISIFLGGIFYGLFSAVFGVIIRVPVVWLMSWADGRIPE